MAKVLQLKVNRTFKHPVKVAYYDEDGKLQKDEFIGVFKMPTNDSIEGKMIIDQLIAVENLNMIDDNGESLKGEDLLDAVRNDSDISEAVSLAWREAMEKKDFEAENLIEIVRYLIGGNKTDPQKTEDQLSEWGFEYHPIEQTQDDVQVLQENWTAYLLFTRLHSCWRKIVISGMEGTRILIDGLDYTQVKVLFDAFHADSAWKDTLIRLHVMEIEAVSIWNLSE